VAREPGGFACMLVLKPRSRSGRRVEPVGPLAPCPGLRAGRRSPVPARGRPGHGARVRTGAN